MRWVEGLTLNQFVEEHLDRPQNLQMLLDLWVKLATRLREAKMAHADLQHGNVLLVPTSGGSLALRLIDYDGMYVPSLAGTRSGEVGHPAYQHPQRLREGIYNIQVDRFSHLTIYCGIRCLMLGRRELWQRFNNGDNLLFREADFLRPRESELFRVLWKNMPDSDARAMLGRVVLACGTRLEEVPLLEDIVTDGKVLPLTFEQEATVNALLSPREKSPVNSVPEDDIPMEWFEEGTVGGATSIAQSPAPLFEGIRPAATTTEPRPATDKWIMSAIQPRESHFQAVRNQLAARFTAAVDAVDELLRVLFGEGTEVRHLVFILVIILLLFWGAFWLAWKIS